MAPIFLKSAKSTQTVDDAGVVITKHVFPTYNEGPYHEDHIPYYMKAITGLNYVPSLAYFSIRALWKVIDRINFDGCPRLTYHAESHTPLLKSLIPFLGPETRPLDIKYVDPSLWGTLIQLYVDLPAFFHVYPIPLSDKYLPLLQGIRSTLDFTLITVLNLSACGYLSDDTISQLKPLTNLCVLDMSRTAVSSWGIKMLSMCLVRNDDERFGPWGIRIWSMRGCHKIDNKVKEVLGKFPLLSVVGAL
ncbi:hypothetical protein BU17DRAFT_47354 [Hysterangium stoloniferum]|nr:hypothetical protein BU17DRAFT_47354 [Hysterangium stoloniferum]